MTDVHASYNDILQWHRAMRPVPLDQWMRQDPEDRDLMARAGQQIELERIVALASALIDPHTAMAPLDGGEALRRRELERAAKGARREL